MRPQGASRGRTRALVPYRRHYNHLTPHAGILGAVPCSRFLSAVDTVVRNDISSVLRVGLTGPIASGKSTVAARLREHGIPVIDLDRVAHDLMRRDGPAFGPVVAAFGTGILAADGGIDRRVLGAIVFGDEAARLRLNGLVHPLVREEESRRADALASDGARVIVTEAALLIETGQFARFAERVVVGCDPETQRSRLIARDGLSAEEAERRIRAQMTFEEKRKHASRVIDTSGPLEDTLRATDALAEELLARARG